MRKVRGEEEKRRRGGGNKEEAARMERGKGEEGGRECKGGDLKGKVHVIDSTLHSKSLHT